MRLGRGLLGCGLLSQPLRRRPRRVGQAEGAPRLLLLASFPAHPAAPRESAAAAQGVAPSVNLTLACCPEPPMHSEHTTARRRRLRKDYNASRTAVRGRPVSARTPRCLGRVPPLPTGAPARAPPPAAAESLNREADTFLQRKSKQTETLL